MASRTRLPPPPEDEEMDEEMDEEDEEFEEGMDMFEALGSLLATEEGETVAMSLAGLKESTDKIALGIEMQNKILVKILSALTKSAPAPPADSA